MKVLLKNIYYCAAYLAAGSLLFSCSNEEEVIDPYDINYTFLRVSNVAHMVRYKDDGEFIQTVPDEEKLFPVRCNKPAPEDITISFEIDETMVEKYNKKNGTNHTLLKNVKLNDLHIKKGEYVSYDTLKVSYTDKKELISNSRFFILPLAISKATGETKISEDRNLILTYESVAIRVKREMSPNEGAVKMTDFAGWTVTLNGEPLDDKKKGWMLDGSSYTPVQWGADGKNGVYIINFGKKLNLFTIDLLPSLLATCPKWAEIEVSVDGQEYTSMGNVELKFPEDAWTDPLDQCLNLYNPKEVQYVRLTLARETITDSGYDPYLNDIFFYTASVKK